MESLEQSQVKWPTTVGLQLIMMDCFLQTLKLSTLACIHFLMKMFGLRFLHTYFDLDIRFETLNLKVCEFKL